MSTKNSVKAVSENQKRELVDEVGGKLTVKLTKVDGGFKTYVMRKLAGDKKSARGMSAKHGSVADAKVRFDSLIKSAKEDGGWAEKPAKAKKSGDKFDEMPKAGKKSRGPVAPIQPAAKK